MFPIQDQVEFAERIESILKQSIDVDASAQVEVR